MKLTVWSTPPKYKLDLTVEDLVDVSIEARIGSFYSSEISASLAAFPLNKEGDVFAMAIGAPQSHVYVSSDGHILLLHPQQAISSPLHVANRVYWKVYPTTDVDNTD